GQPNVQDVLLLGGGAHPFRAHIPPGRIGPPVARIDDDHPPGQAPLPAPHRLGERLIPPRKEQKRQQDQCSQWTGGQPLPPAPFPLHVPHGPSSLAALSHASFPIRRAVPPSFRYFPAPEPLPGRPTRPRAKATLAGPGAYLRRARSRRLRIHARSRSGGQALITWSAVKPARRATPTPYSAKARCSGWCASVLMAKGTPARAARRAQRLSRSNRSGEALISRATPRSAASSTKASTGTAMASRRPRRRPVGWPIQSTQGEARAFRYRSRRVSGS